MEFLAPLYLPLPLPSSSHALLRLKFTTSSMYRFPVVVEGGGGSTGSHCKERSELNWFLMLVHCSIIYIGETRIVTIP